MPNLGLNLNTNRNIVSYKPVQIVPLNDTDSFFFCCCCCFSFSWTWTWTSAVITYVWLWNLLLMQHSIPLFTFTIVSFEIFPLCCVQSTGSCYNFLTLSLHGQVQLGPGLLCRRRNAGSLLISLFPLGGVCECVCVFVCVFVFGWERVCFYKGPEKALLIL